MAWATMFMPEAPGAEGDDGQDAPEDGQPGELLELAVGQAEEEPVGHDGQPTTPAPAPRRWPAAGRPRRSSRSRPRKSSPRKNSSSKNGAPTTVRIAITAKPVPVRPAGQLGRRAR